MGSAKRSTRRTGPPIDVEFHPFCIESQLMQNRRLEVGDIVRMLDSPVAYLIGIAVNGPTLDAAASQP